MPRLDGPEGFHHVMVQGIDRRPIYERGRSPHARLTRFTIPIVSARLRPPATCTSDLQWRRVPCRFLADGVLRRAAVFSRNHGSRFASPAGELVRDACAQTTQHAATGEWKNQQGCNVTQKRGAVPFGGRQPREDGATSPVSLLRRQFLHPSAPALPAVLTPPSFAYPIPNASGGSLTPATKPFPSVLRRDKMCISMQGTGSARLRALRKTKKARRQRCLSRNRSSTNLTA